MSKDKVSFTFQDVFPKGSECTRQNDVFRYFQNLVSEDEARSFEQHLTDCSCCAGLLADLDETNSAADATIIDAGKADQIFSQTKAKLEDRLGVPSRAVHIPPPARSFHIPAYVNLLLIGLVAALIYPSYKSFVLNNEVTELQKQLSAEKSKVGGVSQQEVDALKKNYENQIQNLNEERSQMLQPDLSGSAVYAVRTERSASSQTINVPFGTQQTFNIVFSVPGDFKSYAVEIFSDGNQVWQKEITVAAPADSPSALISINLKAEYFKDGVYRLKISGVDKQKNPMQLDEFKLKVSH